MPADRRLTALAAAILMGPTSAPAAPRLDPLFSDHSVIQRDKPILVRGGANPNERLTIRFGRIERVAIAGRDGQWRASFPPAASGGPHRIEVRGEGGAVAIADDILVGDVWLCSGQSNMEFTVRRSLNGEAEAQGADDPQLRLLTVAQHTGLTPQIRFKDPPAWKPAAPQSVADFSAACYFMARHLRSSQKVPIGLINASWGGTRIRPWMDETAARASGNAADAELLELYRRNPTSAARQFGEQWGTWWRQRAGDAEGQEPWNDSGRLQWRRFPSMSLWEEWGQPEFAEFNGYVWARRRFTLTAVEAAQAATLSLGIIDDLDQTWVNGVGVGSSFGWSSPRDYPIAKGVLRAGENEIVINVGDSWGFGGFQGPPDRLKLTFANGRVESIGDGWEYSIVRGDMGSPPRAPWDTHAGLGTLYNAMIAPLGSLRLKGIAWYQGESDVGVPGYDLRLAALATGWRRQFGDPQLPFLVVALAGFGRPVSQPTTSGWAALIDEQRRAAAADPASALVVATDLGERDDIHPPNKQEVGRRLALAARRIAYSDSSVPAGPLPIAARRTAAGIEVRFTGALRTLSGDRPLGMELCGKDQQSCRYVEARASGNGIIIRDDGREATRVRHAWSDFPILNLYGGDLPVPPFELPID